MLSMGRACLAVHFSPQMPAVTAVVAVVAVVLSLTPERGDIILGYSVGASVRSLILLK